MDDAHRPLAVAMEALALRLSLLEWSDALRWAQVAEVLIRQEEAAVREFRREVEQDGRR